MRVQFWGTRGSIATPGPCTVRYGGNTSCVSVLTRDGTHLVLDAGTGMRRLGIALMAQESAAQRGHILIGHTHWDHIQGFPFFAPLFKPGHSWDVYAPRGLGSSLRETLAGQMQYTYFPVSLESMGADIRYHDLVEGQFMIDRVRVTAAYLNHPALTLGYRIEADGITVVYATDHECHARSAALGAPIGQVLGALHPGDIRHRNFVSGADLLIHDCQYTAAEYPQRAGWGHSTLEYVVDLALQAGVKRLELFHHDPGRDDDAVDTMLAAGRRRAGDAGSGLLVSAAAEGSVIELTAAAPKLANTRDDAEPAVDTNELSRKEVLIACADAQLAQRVRAAVAAEGIAAVYAGTRQAALQATHTDRLALAVVERQLGADDGAGLTRDLRATDGLDQLPVILIGAAGQEFGSVDAPAEVVAGSRKSPLTEWVTPTFSAQYLRTKLRAGLLRSRARWQLPPVPANEAQRLESLRRLALLDSPAEERFDRITRLAARQFAVPIALISLIDSDRQWFKSRVGMDIPEQETSREASFCAHAIVESKSLVVPDALDDDRFADNPLVQAHPRLRFYAGHPIAAPDGNLIGTLCLIDHQPRNFSDSDIKTLSDLAAMVEQELLARP